MRSKVLVSCFMILGLAVVMIGAGCSPNTASLQNGKAAHAYSAEIVDNGDGSCTVYPIGDPTETVPHPIFGWVFSQYPDLIQYKVTKDIANIQTALLDFSRVILSAKNLSGETTAFEFGNLTYPAKIFAAIYDRRVVIRKSVTIEGADSGTNGLSGRTVVRGGEHCFVILPNIHIYYQIPGAGTAPFAFSPLYVTNVTTLAAAAISSTPLLSRPEVTIKHIDSEQASHCFALINGTKDTLIDDVRVRDMNRPYQNSPTSPFPGKFLMCIDSSPGLFNAPSLFKVEKLTISNCSFEAKSSDPSIQTTAILISGALNAVGQLNFKNNNITIQPGGSSSFASQNSFGITILGTPNSIATIEGGQINILPKPAAAQVTSGGIGLNNTNNVGAKDLKITGVSNYGLFLRTTTGTAEANKFNNIDLTGLTVDNQYVACTTASVKNNTGTNICVPAGTSCEKFLLDLGINNKFYYLPCLIDKVGNFNLQQGISNSLDAKLSNALASLNAANADQRNDAVNKLEAFINECEAQRGTKLSDAQANELIAYANVLISALQLGYCY